MDPIRVASNGFVDPLHPAIQPLLIAATHPVVLIATVTGGDLDGDGNPDLPPPPPPVDEPKPEPKPVLDLSHVHAVDHAALIIAVGQALHHVEIV